MIAALIPLISAALNRARGDDRWKPSWLPGRALFYVAPAMGLLALTAQPWPKALAVALGYLFWAVWAWGYPLAALGGVTPSRAPDALERALMAIGTPWAAMARMAFILPCLVALALLGSGWQILIFAPAFVGLSVLSYYAFLAEPDMEDWRNAELATGALWGILIIIA